MCNICGNNNTHIYLFIYRYNDLAHVLCSLKLPEQSIYFAFAFICSLKVSNYSGDLSLFSTLLRICDAETTAIKSNQKSRSHHRLKICFYCLFQYVHVKIVGQNWELGYWEIHLIFKSLFSNFTFHFVNTWKGTEWNIKKNCNARKYCSFVSH